MKRIIITSIVLMLSVTSILAARGMGNKNRFQNDTSSYVEISGKLVDNKSNNPVVFATVFISNTNIATVTNSDGEFSLKIPKSLPNVEISFAHLGYKNNTITLANWDPVQPVVQMQAVKLPIDEVVVRSIDPVQLINKALDQVSDNYSSAPEMQTAFYREAIKQNRKYVSISEAVLDIYKAPYKTSFDSDRLKIFKGRKSSDVKKMDTLLVKLQGGPKTSLMIDIVKHPGDLLARDVMEYYTFELAGITSIDNRETYIIKFDQIDNLELPLYKGNLYIDTKTHAFAGFEFSLSDKGLPYASSYLVRKKPANLKIGVDRAYYLVRYRKADDNWCLNYVRSELDFDAKWKKKVFRSNISIMLEMAVTDRDKENVVKFPLKETSKFGDIFSEQVSRFEDDKFWGDYNTIKPEEAIEIAISKLNKKLKRRQ